MGPSNNLVLSLRAQIASIEGILADLRTQLTDAEAHYNQAAPAHFDTNGRSQIQSISHPPFQVANGNVKNFESLVDQLELPLKGERSHSWELAPEEYKRYGRQLIMPEIGLRGQLRLRNASVLIVGVGGLGCPAATYLAGAGVGKIGLIDGDTVELSNLHRQVLHTEKWLGLRKVDSAVQNLTDRNSLNQYVAHHYSLEPEIAVETMRKYDLILDCTDRPSTRYLISDAAVLAGKPVITASALRTEGQLMVLNNPPKSHDNPGGFCYRCVFPKPPPAESVLTCGEGGILGPVVGVMGVLMAMEAIKMLSPLLQEDEDQYPTKPPYELVPPSLLLYSAYSTPAFRSVKLRGKRKGCPSCSDTATITEHSLSEISAFCPLDSPAAVINTTRVSAKEYSKVRESAGTPHVLVDVREKVQFDICHLKGSINLPYSDISRDLEASIEKLDETINRNSNLADRSPLYFICRYGNDSQLAANKFKELPPFKPCAKYEVMGDITGGLRAWRQSVDPSFPEY